MKRLSMLGLTLLAMLLLASGCNVKKDSTSGAMAGEPGPEKDTVAAVVAASTPADTSIKLPVMLELGSEGCKPCEQMKPVMAGLEKDFGDKIRIVFHDVRKEQAIAKQYGIRLIPTQVFLDSEGKEFFRHEGFFARDEIVKVFREHGVVL